MSSKHKPTTDFVEPDLPITPMLDMSFQLMAFFIFTFRPAPTEGQIAMSLPKQEGGESQAIPNPTDEKPEVFVVKVNAASNGTISRITIEKKDDVDTRSIDLGASVEAYQKELRARYAAISSAEAKAKAKVTLEMDNNLLHEYVVQLLDNGQRSGFTNIAPVPPGGGRKR